MRPNENKISHRWQERTWLAMDVLKSYEGYAPERPAVGCIVWLGLFRGVFNSVLQTNIKRDKEIGLAVFDAVLNGREGKCAGRRLVSN